MQKSLKVCTSSTGATASARAFYAARGFSTGPTGDVDKDAYGPGDELVAFRKAQVS